MKNVECRDLGLRLRAVRERLGETQTEFASRVRVTQPTISRWEDTGPAGNIGRAYVQQILAEIERVLPATIKTTN